MLGVVHGEIEDATRPQRTSHGRQGCTVVGYMLQDAVTDHQVELLVEQGQGSPICSQKVGVAVQTQPHGGLAGVGYGRRFQVDADQRRAPAGQIEGIGPVAAPHVENTPALYVPRPGFHEAQLKGSHQVKIPERRKQPAGQGARQSRKTHAQAHTQPLRLPKPDERFLGRAVIQLRVLTTGNIEMNPFFEPSPGAPILGLLAVTPERNRQVDETSAGDGRSQTHLVQAYCRRVGHGKGESHLLT